MGIFESNDTTLEIVYSICTANSLRSSFEQYANSKHLLSDWKFIFDSQNGSGSTPGYAINKKFSFTGQVRSLFRSEKIFVLDPHIFSDMTIKKEAEFTIDYSISLDTQAASYIESYLSNKNISSLPKDFHEAFLFIAQPQVNVDSLPYLMENLQSLRNKDNHKKVFSTLKNYEILKHIDHAHYQKTKTFRATISDDALNKNANEFLYHLLYYEKIEKIIQEFEFQKNSFYCILLKMITIQLSTKKSTSYKMIEFLNFLNEDMATIFLREAYIALTYFEKDDKLIFFQKIKPNKGKHELLEQIKNMAWDLLITRHIEKNDGGKILEANYFFKALLTFDKGLIELMDLFYLRSVAFNEKTGDFIPFYHKNIEEEISEKMKFSEELKLKYFSLVAIKSRSERRKLTRDNLPKGL